MERLRKNPLDTDAKTLFEKHKTDLGFGLLLKKYVVHVQDVTPETIQKAVDSTVPRVAPMFWSFPAMVALGFLMLALFALSFWSTLKVGHQHSP